MNELPTSIKALGYYLNPRIKQLNANMFNQNELEAIDNLINIAEKYSPGKVTYPIYQQAGLTEFPWEQSLPDSIKWSNSSPLYNIASTLGRFNYTKDGDRYKIVDTYNFNKGLKENWTPSFKLAHRLLENIGTPMTVNFSRPIKNNDIQVTKDISALEYFNPVEIPPLKGGIKYYGE